MENGKVPKWINNKILTHCVYSNLFLARNVKCFRKCVCSRPGWHKNILNFFSILGFSDISCASILYMCGVRWIKSWKILNSARLCEWDAQKLIMCCGVYFAIALNVYGTFCASTVSKDIFFAIAICTTLKVNTHRERERKRL